MTFNPHPDAHKMLVGMSYSRFLKREFELSRSRQDLLIRRANLRASSPRAEVPNSKFGNSVVGCNHHLAHHFIRLT